MRTRPFAAVLRRVLPSLILAVAGSAAASAVATGAGEQAQPAVGVELAKGVHLVRGAFVPGRQPDGNSVVFVGPDGAVVVDTGRHPEHTEAVIAQASVLHVVPKAIVNTHWHLDHTGGNVLLRRRFPQARVYASDAIGEALTGFLADYHQQLERLLASDRPTEEEKASFRRELGLIDAGAQLRPDDVVQETGRRQLAGLLLELHLERHAVTGGDLWLRDPASGVLVAGDLVTLPVPFLDTACPKRWLESLERLEAADWRVLVPGHGPPLDRQQLAAYRRAFAGLLACAASTRPDSECVDGWFRDAGELAVTTDAGNGRELLAYYMANNLRPADRAARLCG